MIEDLKHLGPITFMWEGNKHGEKYIQTVKKEFVSQKGNFAEILMTKIYVKKILFSLTAQVENEDIINDNFNIYELKL